jgi:hypothetical protein
VLPHRAVSVVIANREYEAWFIAAAASLHGVRTLQICAADLLVSPEQPRDAKGWLGSRMTNGYGETTDQPAFSAMMDLDQAIAGSPSFAKLCREWDQNVVP